MRSKQMRFKRWILPLLAISSMCGVAYMIYTGKLIPNELLYIRSDDIIGCDVSRYQGNIQWEQLSKQGISFAFIKATEGSSHIDPNFKTNWESAGQTELYIGAYHFFSFESPGINQAEHFFNTVGKREGMLPPVVDIEFYGGFNEENINPDVIRVEVNKFISSIKKSYGVNPIIYTTPETYDYLIDGYYDDCLLWIRSILTYPKIDRKWAFWQYTNREQLEGYKGEERYIDMNVFCGDGQMIENILLR